MSPSLSPCPCAAATTAILILLIPFIVAVSGQVILLIIPPFPRHLPGTERSPRPYTLPFDVAPVGLVIAVAVGASGRVVLVGVPAVQRRRGGNKEIE